MRLAFVAAIVAAGAVGSVAVTGCSHPAGASPASVLACTDFGVHAINHHIVVTRMPAACRGLTRAQVNFAVGNAIYEVARAGQHKAAGRKRAAADGRYVAGLVTAVPVGTPSARTGSLGVQAATGSASGTDRPLTVAALVTWLITIGIGAYLLAGWIRHGGIRRRRPDGGLPPQVILAHPVLALAGLILWTIFVVTSWAGVAWAALVTLLPVLGLGMALVLLGHGGGQAEELPTVAPARPGARGAPGVDTALAGMASAESATLTEAPAANTRWPLIIAAHGVLATTTVLLVLLATLGTR